MDPHRHAADARMPSHNVDPAVDAAAAADLDELLPQVAAGRLPLHAVLPAVLAANLLLYARTSHDPHVHAFADQPSGRLVVPACTAAEHVPAAWPLWREMRGAALLPLLSGNPLLLNPEGPATTLITAESLRAVPR